MGGFRHPPVFLIKENNMDRRLFLKRAFGGIVLTGTPFFMSCAKGTSIRFGVITDLHYSKRKPYGTRFFPQSIEKLKEAMDVFNRSNLDFLIELGDLKDQDNEPLRENTLAYLQEIEKVFQSFSGPTYHVLGNHDMDSISKDDFFAYTSNYGKADKKAFYSFKVKDVKFIVLDANYNNDGTPYNCGNYTWTETYIPQEEIEWLRNELTGSKYPVFIFIHQMLDSFSDIASSLCVNNAEEIVSLLEESGNVFAVFQGHHHAGHYSFRNNIHYWTMKGMIEGCLPENNSFAVVEIDPEGNTCIDGFYNCEDRILKK